MYSRDVDVDITGELSKYYFGDGEYENLETVLQKICEKIGYLESKIDKLEDRIYRDMQAIEARNNVRFKEY